MRLARLDVLRGIAVLLVIFRHAEPPSAEVAAGVRAVTEPVIRFGWIGVDLFFVLSGFLVAGLLFAEYQRYGAPARLRFWVRRGFKIYPSFYLFLLFGWCMQMYLGFTFPGPPRTPDRHFYEAVFLRNYTGGVWSHTWSVDVEEHFYLALPLLLMLLAVSSGPDPFRRTWIALPMLAIAVLGWRLHSVAAPFPHPNYLYPTHFRIDALLWGVLLAYVYHYRDRAWLDGLGRAAPVALLAALVLLAPALVGTLGESMAIATWGLTTIALGFTLLVALALVPPRSEAARLGWLGSTLAAIGIDSYSIYLWHLPVRLWMMPGAYDRMKPEIADPTAAFLLEHVVYLVSAIVIGIVLARVVERPALALRERIAPARSRPLDVAPSPPEGLAA